VLAAVEGLRHEADPSHIVRVAVAAFHVERLEGCRDALWRVVRDGRAGGAVASAINALLILAFDAYHAGRWDEARDLATEGLGLCDAHGYQLLAAPGRLCLALLAAARGDGDAVRNLTDALTGWGVPRGARKVVVYAGQARTLAALGRSDFEDAYQEAVAVSPPGVLEPDNGHAMWLTMDLVEAAVRTHRHREAAAHVRVMQEVGMAALAPRLALLAAGAAAIAAPADRARGLFDAALALPEVERWPFDLARVRLAYGEHLRRARATNAAREHLTAAFATFHDLGARSWAARATTELRAASHHRSRGRPGGRRGTGRASLTAQELEVARLAASGMTNRQIADRLHLSRRTVDSHLYRVFPKLGVTARAALGDALSSCRA
jgi:DNA-binding CsgD family transcriptional regulator